MSIDPRCSILAPCAEIEPIYVVSLHMVRVYLNSVFGKRNRLFAAGGLPNSNEIVYPGCMIVLVCIYVGRSYVNILIARIYCKAKDGTEVFYAVFKNNADLIVLPLPDISELLY